MGNTNKAKAEQLGMPFGTATNKLRKQLLFKYVQLAGDNYCFSCGEVIEDITDFTIEHKEPWFNRDTEQFWDLDNIAFSHAKCNVPHTYRNGNSHITENAPEGTKWCSWGQHYVGKENFYRSSSRKDGLHSDCIDCNAASVKSRRKKKQAPLVEQ